MKNSCLKRSLDNFFDDDHESECSLEKSDLSNCEDDDLEGKSSDDNCEDARAPEVLVRRENRVISVVRVVVILILFASASATAFFVYRFTRNAELEAYQVAFEGAASSVTESLIEDTNLKFWMGRTLSTAVTVAMVSTGSSKTNLTIPASLWDSMTQSARLNGNAILVGWNPLLESDEERREFEAFAAPQSIQSGANEECFVCGSPDRGYANPEDMVLFVGYGQYKCGNVEASGRKGLYPASICDIISVAAQEVCECVDIPPEARQSTNEVKIPEKLWKVSSSSEETDEPYENPPYHAIWQAMSRGATVKLPVMYNEISDGIRANAIRNMLNSQMPMMSETVIREGYYFENYAGYVGHTSVLLYYPVYDESGSIVGSVSFDMLWNDFLVGVFPPNSDLVDVVIENTCGQNLTYSVNMADDTLVFVGEGDRHENDYSGMVYTTTYDDYEQIVVSSSGKLKDPKEYEFCRYRFHVFSSQRFEDSYTTSNPIIYAVITGSVFLFTSLVFVLYDYTVRKRQSKIMDAANKTNDIVVSLFPENVRDRLLGRAAGGQENDSNKKGGSFIVRPQKEQMQQYLSGAGSALGKEPIADLFASATVCFIDIANFTAWSSEREPAQVFTLLETLYQNFDSIAKRLGVFKVETIGDSYVAVCGLPTRRTNHAVIMAHFARSCLRSMKRLVRNLEVQLGPSTGDLRARVGLHSGPVTAGVLRGEKARFQLFGDTVNTASRLQASGRANLIHASQATANLIISEGKENWVKSRTEKVTMKGKGDWQTYWIQPRTTGSRSSSGSASVFSDDDLESGRGDNSTAAEDPEQTNEVERNLRLVDWNVAVLFELLQKLVASRNGKMIHDPDVAEAEHSIIHKNDGRIIIDEMTKILIMPSFDEASINNADWESQSIPPVVKEQLREFVQQICALYRTEVPFHNFKHASHVIMSAGKLMRRIMQPEGVDYDRNAVDVARDIHQSTYGISSDPLMQFSIVFSALIHDADHTGLTNAELIKLKTRASQVYREKSVAEQNSVDLAWQLLFDSRFRELRACIYTTKEELHRFRQLIINAVMATDIADKELKQLRDSRWGDAFYKKECALDINGNDGNDANLEKTNLDRKATIVFECIVQASDIIHCMQHWQTYQKFNKRLFEERYLAWLNGHFDKDPSLGWYGGELWFYDNYIIPLAEKLNKCGVFGVSYDENLTWARENRREWESKGKEIVADMASEMRAKYMDRVARREKELLEQQEE